MLWNSTINVVLDGLSNYTKYADESAYADMICILVDRTTVDTRQWMTELIRKTRTIPNWETHNTVRYHDLSFGCDRRWMSGDIRQVGIWVCLFVCVCLCVCVFACSDLSVLIPHTPTAPKSIKKKNTYLITVTSMIQIQKHTQHEECECLFTRPCSATWRPNSQGGNTTVRHISWDWEHGHAAVTETSSSHNVEGSRWGWRWWLGSTKRTRKLLVSPHWSVKVILKGDWLIHR